MSGRCPSRFHRAPLAAKLVAALWGLWIALLAGTSHAAAPDAAPAILRIASSHSLPVSRRMSMGLNKAVIVELPVDAQDAIISHPGTLDASVLTARRVLIYAKAIGDANVFLLGRDGRKLALLDITVKRDLTDLSRMLKSLLPGSHIKLQASGDGVVLSGTVATPADASRAAEVAAQYLKEAKVVNLITAGSKEQVLLKITVAELQREAIRRIGMNLPSAVVKGGAFTFAKIMQNGLPVSAASIAGAVFAGATQAPIASGAALQGTANWNGNSVTAMLESLERAGLSRTLAEPTLIAISGEAAKFHAGGEFPIPVSQQNNTISVSWKSFGVNVAFTPYVLSEKRISLKVAAEVSELSSQGAVTLQAITIPAVQTRKAETVVEMPSGSALAMAGLLSDQTRRNIDGVPGLKDLPVLGTLFRSQDFKSNQSELVILVTPYVVRPTERNQLSRPDEGLVPPSPLRGLLLGQLNRVYSQLPKDAATGDFGYIIDYPAHGVKD
ncbi:MAG: type II and III secretion system protein family protein [Hyphomicrobiaceae bacterium]